MAHKEIRKMIRKLEADGHTVELRKGGHYRVKHRDGQGIVHFAATPSDHRAIRNIIRDLKKEGFNI